MNIELAQVYGFCPGVRRAVEMVNRHLHTEGPLSTLGAIVHNAQVVDALADRGARVAENLESVREPAVAITAHGAGKALYQEIGRRDLELVDTTCPIVKRAQEAAKHLAEDGYAVLIYGEAAHPEVKGLLSWTEGRGHATLDPDSLRAIKEGKLALISQTTKGQEAFWRFVERMVERLGPQVQEMHVVDTTCPETGRRYDSARELAQRVDAILVVGSRNSANTRKLAETCEETGVRTYFIESAEEIQGTWFNGVSRVGVTAGASTPDEAIDQVIRRLQALEGGV
ncbi:MAG: 4-hydroxy-3-methylbut-2-enyl diphosphate reductase [Candidatus Bipolaricaulota bacterium]